TDEAGVTDDMAGIWQGGGGLMSDGPHRVILTSGNGISPAAGPGDAPPGQLAESVIQLAQRPDGQLAAKDFFSPANAPSLDAGDLDFGSGGPVGFPVGTTAYPHILAQAGKYGVIFLLNRDSLGGREQGAGDTNDALFASQAYNGLWGHPAIFEQSTSPLPPSSSGLSDYMYYVGKSDYLRAFQLGTTSTGLPELTDVANSTFAFGYSSGSPVVTSGGTDPSSAVVWLVDSPGGVAGTGSSLVTFDAVPQRATGGGLQMQELGDWPIGTAGQFSIVATSRGKVYVGTRDGHLLGFGLPKDPALRRSGTARFGDTPVNTAATRTATVTTTRTVTVTGVSTSAVTAPDPFTAGRVTETSPGATRTVTFPVTLHRGDTLHAAVAFSAATPGGSSGALSFATAGGVPVSVPLVADATRTGLYATAPTLPLLLSLNDGTRVGPVPVGLRVSGVATIVNGGTTPQRITRVSAPAGGGRLTYRALPKTGTLISPGQSIAVQVIYAPAKVVPTKVTLTITGSSGTPARVAVSGTSQKAVSKMIASKRVSFGDVRVGHTVTRSINVLNDGNTAATILKTVLLGPFHLPYKVADGLPFNGGYNLAIPVTFTPAKAGRVTGSYTFSWTDWFGTHALTIPITATGVS
ncbi:MAG: choice-of-anchor D domain-containing protein, partial [Streptosporangiaceae bacterium]